MYSRCSTILSHLCYESNPCFSSWPYVHNVLFSGWDAENSILGFDDKLIGEASGNKSQEVSSCPIIAWFRKTINVQYTEVKRRTVETDCTAHSHFLGWLLFKASQCTLKVSIAVFFSIILVSKLEITHWRMGREFTCPFLSWHFLPMSVSCGINKSIVFLHCWDGYR